MTVPKYSIGSIAVDEENRTITLQPGTYLLTQPIVFGIAAETRIVGMAYDAAPKDGAFNVIDATALLQDAANRLANANQSRHE